jgi:L-seryl-tRNA(Ser) seleniumtransferase
LITQVLEQALRNLVFERWDEIPAMRMIRMTADEIRARAERLRSQLHDAGISIDIIEGQSVAGGGSSPEQSLPTWLLAISGNAPKLERKLRASHPPIVARIENDRLVLDLRTVFASEEEALVLALRSL